MKKNIIIQPSGLRFTAEPKQTILQAALGAGIGLPFGCQGGVCGSCKGTILQGTVDYGDYQDTTLTETEKAAGKALFCCAVPLEDLVIQAREISEFKDIHIKKLPCRVESITQVNHDVVILKLKLPPQETFKFMAGQYINFLLKEGRIRSFSLANPSHETNLLELHIRLYPGGNFSAFLQKEIKERSILRFEGPLGSFYLREDKNIPIIFMAGATGFAPIKSIIETALHKGLTRPMTLYWGVRAKRDLYAHELALSWVEAGHGLIQYHPILSNPLPEDNWTGRVGFVHEAILMDYQSLEQYEVYACGPPPMVEAGFAQFTQERKLPESSFFADLFAPASR
jgi:CDP-4-dehydro-6-deoxyglucose reductase